jgi:uncharacterized membrane protein (DUF485 family)
MIPRNSSSRDGRSQATASIGSVAGMRLSLLLLLVLAAIALGFSAGRFVLDAIPDLTRARPGAVLVLTSAVVVSMIFMLLAALDVVRFLRCGLPKLRAALSSLVPAFSLFALAGFSGAWLGAPASSRPSAESQLGIMFGFGARSDAIHVPFFPYEGRANGSCNANHRFDQRYIRPAAEITRAIRQLGMSLASCSTRELPMTIDVLGFASTSEFARCDGAAPSESVDATVSDLMNHNLAEARRDAVIALLNEGAEQARAAFAKERGDSSVADWLIAYEPSASVRRWSSRTEMIRDPQFGFRDRTTLRGAETYDSLRGGLTRRVDIVIKNKGACALDN